MTTTAAASPAGCRLRDDEEATHSMDQLQRFAAGDADAFEILFRQFQGEVYGWIVRIVRDTAAAEDLTVETFWRIHRSCRRFDPSRPFGAWARRVATHAALDYLRSHRREPPLPPGCAAPAAPDTVWDREVRERVAAAFGALPVRLRVPATLALVEEQSYEEIAAACGTSVNAIKSRVF